MYVFEIISSLGTFGALCAAIWQLHLGVKGDRERDEDARVERSLQLFDEVVAAGGTAEAFHRLSVALREQGTTRVGRTSWYCLSDADLDSGGFFDVKSAKWGQLFADLYTVLWFFERVEIDARLRIWNACFGSLTTYDTLLHDMEAAFNIQGLSFTETMALPPARTLQAA